MEINKHVYFGLIAASLMTSCDHSNNPCKYGEGMRLNNREGIVRYDERFDQLVIFYHVPGSIDSFEVYIPCNLTDHSEQIKPGTHLVFDCVIGLLPESEQPLTQVGSEEFFIVRLLAVTGKSE